MARTEYTITYTTKQCNVETSMRAGGKIRTHAGAARVVARRLGIKPSEVFVVRLESTGV